MCSFLVPKIELYELFEAGRFVANSFPNNLFVCSNNSEILNGYASVNVDIQHINSLMLK